MQQYQQQRIINANLLNPSQHNLPEPTLPNVEEFLLATTENGNPPPNPSRNTSMTFTNAFSPSEATANTTHHMEAMPINPGRTLTRPDRRRSQAFFTTFNSFRRPNLANQKKRLPEDSVIKTNSWVYASWVLTCCFPSVVVANIFGKHDPLIRQAWREKVALCIIIAIMMGIVGFLTFGFQNVVCPSYSDQNTHLPYDNLTPLSGNIAIHGSLYRLQTSGSPHISVSDVNIDGVVKNSIGADLSLLFPPVKGVGACSGLDDARYPLFPCIANISSTGTQIWPNATLSTALDNSTSGCHIGISPLAGNILQSEGDLVYDYLDIFNAIQAEKGNKKLMIFGGHVLDVSLFFYDNTSANILGSGVRDLVFSHIGKDASRAFSTAGLLPEGECLTDYLRIASVDSIQPACLASTVITYISLIIILVVVLAKFVLALYFTYVIGWRLGNNRAYQRAMEDLRRRKEEYSRNGQPHQRPTTRSNIRSGSSRSDGSDIVMEPVNAISGRSGPMTSESRRTAAHLRESTRDLMEPNRSWDTNFGFMDIAAPPLDHETKKILDDPTLMHCIAMVPCYSEGAESLKATLDSVANSYYPSTHKVLFVIADGIVTGSGNAKSTPDILIDMIEVDERFRMDDPKRGGDATPFSYVAIADGANRKNFAKVYAGWYKYDVIDQQQKKGKNPLRQAQSSSSSLDINHQGSDSGSDGNAYTKTMRQRRAGRVPMLLIVKCGNEEERDPAKPAGKPGNRGKRDSQVVLMNFLCKVMFDDRMTELEFDIFFKLFTITGVNPEKYECVLMVDADTRIYPDSLSHMVACLIRDDRVMGLCGETKILNKWDSWVTMIQVFEYFISHHLSKAFESVFGGVTCLPGCFSMYRIKSPKGPNGFWVPILANPDVVEEYSDHIVDTLHKKNLLLLGEDRFLSTMMLRQFPKRRMVFVPPAICKTVVPDAFKVLLSQRRRWINSTIHNLMELLLVKDLCGTFCISMQFIIFMDLVGTVVLPAAISFTIAIIVMTITKTGADTELPMILLALILGLPAVLILMTANRPIYIFWMIVYLLSLPIWNFVLPVYAFWHFDDFSWGATRKVSGEDTAHDHSARDGEFDGKGINMKRWSEWVQIIRADHERQMGRALPITSFVPPPSSAGSYSQSIASGDSERWSSVGSSPQGAFASGSSDSGYWAVGAGPPPSLGGYAMSTVSYRASPLGFSGAHINGGDASRNNK
ncbi:Chitin synthase, class 3 [Physocladia obscura]|uniref:chitin synthase n=1 Tax=Physocladia obscura TaxID=109957 RepID=A0AAD5T527_9FUNG|nr:Chitin synthase, class 3 [Physocladia obscura]